MASYSVPLQPPPPFRFDSPDEWPKWRRRFEQFRIASGLSGEGEERQVSTLLYCLGEDAEDVLASTAITDAARKKYSDVLSHFDTFFKVRKNVIFERARFNRRVQGESESVEQYITSLYSLAEDCQYGALKEEMIRDRIVVGIRDSSLSEKLQLDADLTLEKVKTLVRQREAVHEQQALLQRGTLEETSSLDFVGRRSFQSKPKGPKQGGRGTPRPSTTRCTRCGKGPHAPQSCPARDATCHKCGRTGHFAAKCYSKLAAVDSLEVDELDFAYLNTVGKPTSPLTTWNVHVQVNGHQLDFKVDTGAEVTAVSEGVYHSMRDTGLRKPTKRLCGPDSHPLEVLGSTTAELRHRGTVSTQEVYVVRHLQSNLLGLPAIKALQLVSPVDAIHEAATIDQKFPQLFEGLGTMAGEYHIQLKPDAKPVALFTARNVPIPLRGQVRAELERMESIGVISRVDEPTDWCAGMVVVPKKSGSVRICVDLKPLNESVLRETFPLPKVDDTLAQLSGATTFSKLDANSGFWQIPLAEDSRHLTTFITPFGRFCFNKLPFGISSAPELFQKRMSAILEGLSGVLCLLDDILVFGRDQKEHDSRLTAALQRVRDAGVTLNRDKCEFSKSRLTFLGHIVDKDGISADPEKTSAIRDMATPTNITELRRFMGMANQLGKFSPNIATLSQPLRELLSSKRAWHWGPAQEEAFSMVKAELQTPRVLALYNPTAEVRVSADASSHGLGAVLLQKTHQAWRPVAYASRAMTPTEGRYAQIEKEALATTWACEKFSPYILGKRISLETDHKPLVPLLGTKHLDSLPPRVLRFRLRLMRFDYSIQHVPGKFLYTADALSRSPLHPADSPTMDTHDGTESYVAAVISSLPASKERLAVYRRAQAADPICQKVSAFCRSTWPNKHAISTTLQPYWDARGHFSLHDDLLLYGTRIVVPHQLQLETLQKLHQGHQGIQRCRARTYSVWWPGVSRAVEDFVRRCPACSKSLVPAPEPLRPTPLPAHPWAHLAADLFELQNSTYLVVVDYFSRYPEVVKLTSTTSAAIITALKSIFSRHGIPAVFMSDNGPQFTSHQMKSFAATYGFQHVTSSPHYPQSNGLAERMVKTVKALLSDAPDPYIALLSYRATPLQWCSYSPAELLMGRKVRTDVPTPPGQLLPQWSYLDDFRSKDEEIKKKQKRHFDRRHRVRPLDPLADDAPVWVHGGNSPVQGRVVSTTELPRSYIVATPAGQVRRNRIHLTPRVDHPEVDTDPLVTSGDHATPEVVDQTPANPERDRILTRSRTGVHLQPPERFCY